jgi:hypothetical protein
VSVRQMTYIGCDCCGDAGDCADTAAEAQRKGGFKRRIGVGDICRRCQRHKTLPARCRVWHAMAAISGGTRCPLSR